MTEKQFIAAVKSSVIVKTAHDGGFGGADSAFYQGMSIKHFFIANILHYTYFHNSFKRVIQCGFGYV